MRTRPLLAALLLPVSVAAAQDGGPPGWRRVADAGQADPVSFEAMPPGFHITTGPGVVLFDPAAQAGGRFSVEAEVFLFPGDTQNGYGVFVGGQGLEGGRGSYLAFVLRRDGSAAVLEARDGRVLERAPWARHAAIATPGANGMAKNLLRVEVGPAAVTLRVNGQEVARLPAEGLDTAGQTGLRVGPALNLHVTSFDLTRHFAPPRPAGP